MHSCNTLIQLATLLPLPIVCSEVHCNRIISFVLYSGCGYRQLYSCYVLPSLQKKYAEARVYYEKALSLDPGNRLVTENLAKLNRVHKQGSSAL